MHEHVALIATRLAILLFHALTLTQWPQPSRRAAAPDILSAVASPQLGIEQTSQVGASVSQGTFERVPQVAQQVPAIGNLQCL